MPRRVASHIESPGLAEDFGPFRDSDTGNRRSCDFEGVAGLVLTLIAETQVVFPAALRTRRVVPLL